MEILSGNQFQAGAQTTTLTAPVPRRAGRPVMTIVWVSLLCSAGLFLIFVTAINSVAPTDFLTFYSGGRLAVSGHLYDPEAVQTMERERTGRYAPGLLFIRMPVFALLLWPLAQLPYGTAYVLWLLFRACCAAAYVLLQQPVARWPATLIVCWSVPLAHGFANGQDAPILLLWLGLWLYLERKQRPFAAGMALSLCLAKFHLFLLLPVFLIAHRRWATLRGLALGGALLVSGSFLAGGWEWPVQYARTLLLPAIHPYPLRMPNLHGLLRGHAELLIHLIVLALSVFLVVRLDDARAVAVSLAAGLLLSYHAYTADAVILIPAILIAIQKRWLRIPAIVLASPIPWFLIATAGKM